MSLPPVEIPLGAMRFNSDLQKLEYWNGYIWMQIHTHNTGFAISSNTGAGARGIYGAAYAGASNDTIGYINIASQGDATDFGNLSQGRSFCGCSGNKIRTVWGGGGTPSYVSTLDYVNIATTGNASGWGASLDWSATEADGGVANDTRGLFFGGYAGGGNPAGYKNNVNFIQFSTTGTKEDFGDLISGKASQGQSGCSDSIRGWVVGGQYPQIDNNTISYVNIASTGNFEDWGDIQMASTNGFATHSNSTRAVFGGNGSSPYHVQKLEFASKGNSEDFGNLSQAFNFAAGMCSPTRGVWAGATTPSPSSNIMEHVSMQSGGSGVDFGDMTAATAGAKGSSNAHGGLG